MGERGGEAGQGLRPEWGDGVRGNGTLFAHVPCERCQYDLMSLHSGGSCPECGLAIRETVIARRRMRPRYWRRAVRQGAWVWVVAVAAMVTFLLHRGRSHWAMSYDLRWLARLWVLVLLISLVAVVVRMVRERQVHPAEVMLCVWIAGAVWLAVLVLAGMW